MRAAVRAFDGKEKRPLIVAVTQLTSTDQKTLEKELLIKEKMNDVVMHQYDVMQLKSFDQSVPCLGMVPNLLNGVSLNITFPFTLSIVTVPT